MIHFFKFITAYHLFFIVDNVYPEKIDETNLVSRQAFIDRLGRGEGVLAANTERYSYVNGKAEVLSAPRQDIDLSKYDHIVEGGIVIKSGKLVIFGWDAKEPEVTLNVTPGTYRV